MHAIGRCAVAMALVGFLVAVLLWQRAEAGPVLRVYAVGPGPTTLAIDQATHRVFAGTIWRGAAIAVLDSRTGALLRMVALPAGVGPPASLLVDARTGRVSSEAQDGSRAALDAASGAVLAIAPAPIAPRVVPLGGSPPRSILYDPGAGALIVLQGGRAVARLPLTPDTLAVRIYPAYGLAYVALVSGIVRVVDASRGTVIRTVHLAPDPFVQFALDASTAHLFVVSTGAVSMLDARSGVVLRTVRRAGRLFTPLQGIGLWPPSIMIDDRAGLLFILNHESGTLTTLDTRSGALLHSGYAGRLPVAVAADLTRGRLLVACLGDADALGEVFGAGTLNVLDARSGALLRSVRVGVAPVAVAIDATAGRAFVLNRDSDLDFRPARLRADTTPLHRSLAALRRLIPLIPSAMDAPAAGTVTVLDLARL